MHCTNTMIWKKITKSKAIKQLIMCLVFSLIKGKVLQLIFCIFSLSHTHSKKIMEELQVLPEPPSSLLVHFCSRRHAVHRHEENLARLDDPEEHLKIVEDVCKNLLLRNAKVDILVIRVGALMNNSIHVKIEIVEFGNLKNNVWKTSFSFSQ